MITTTISKDEKPDIDYIKTICKIGQKNNCCRYLVAGSTGFECGKENISLKNTIDNRVHQMNAKGDNCKGYNSRLTSN